MVLERLMKILPIAALISAVLFTAAPADARTCENTHGKDFHCHKVLAPRINFHRHHPIKVERCRAHKGRFNNC
jgi:hypothetical protein